MQKVLLRLQTMGIPPRDPIGKSVVVLCNGPKSIRVWSDIITLPVKKPELDHIAPLHSTTIFANPLDKKVLTIAQIAKSYDSLAPNNLISIKIASEII